MDSLLTWAEDRRKTISELTRLGETITFHARNAKIASAVGTGTGIISSVGASICYLIAPATAGASLVPAIVLTGVSVSGGVTSVGSSVTNSLIEKSCMKDVQAALDTDRKSLATLARAIKNARKSTPLNGLEYAKNVCKKIPPGIDVGAQAIAKLLKSEKAAAVLIKLGKTARFAGHIVTFIALPIDIIFFVNDAVDLAKGNVSAAADEVLNLAIKLQEEYDEIMSEVYITKKAYGGNLIIYEQ